MSGYILDSTFSTKFELIRLLSFVQSKVLNVFKFLFCAKIFFFFLQKKNWYLLTPSSAFAVFETSFSLANPVKTPRVAPVCP